MILIGVLLVAVAGAFGVDLAVKNRFNIRGIEVFGWSLGIHGSARLFILGAIVGAAIVLGLALILAGLGRKGSKAAARRQEHREVEAKDDDLSSLRAENSDLRRQLDDRGNDSRTGQRKDEPAPEPSNGGSASSPQRQ